MFGVFLGECAWIDSELIHNMLSFCGSLFPVVKYAYANVPTYPCGQIGFLLCSNSSVSVLGGKKWTVLSVRYVGL